MNDVVIRAAGLTKTFRLYARPHYRFLDMFGLLRRADAYREHAALKDVDLEIHSGEKVAFIGRNGAGKSTLLKLITGVMNPTCGTLDVRQGMHALLQIGVGFHPDFTGRENAYSYLAHLGVTGREANARMEDIVAFAEIEEYIDQPIKTYSSGMVARLMFASSTAVSPEVLVLDEILGVGDAYFAQKSYERIRELCANHGTTVLLVTHDIYSASRLCERTVWLDRGQIMLDSDSATVIKAYEDSIRQQEEHRLRLRKQAQLKAATDRSEPKTRLIVEFSTPAGTPLESPVYFRRVALSAGGRDLATAPLTAANAFDEANADGHLQTEACCWGAVADWEGHAAREMLHFGSPYHKVACVFDLPGTYSAGDIDELSLEVNCGSASMGQLSASVYSGPHERFLGTLSIEQPGWNAKSLDLRREARGRAARVATGDILGTGAIVVRDVHLVDEGGKETFVVTHGHPATVFLSYSIAKRGLKERAQVVITFHRDGVQTACRFITRDLVFDEAQCPNGTIALRIPRVVLGNGSYTLTVMIAEEGYYDKEQTIFFSINPGVYYCLSKVVEFSVINGGLISEGASFVGDGRWEMAEGAQETAQLAAAQGA